jgi:RNA polymerase sigma-70 factor (ECF subfamily)
MPWPVIGSIGNDDAERCLLAECSEYLPALHSFLSRLLGGDQHHAEDLVQETLIRCWLKYEDADLEMLRPWLFTVARNLSIDVHRKNRMRPMEIESDHKAFSELSAAASDEAVLSTLALMEALGGLAPKHRAVLYRTIFLEETEEEVAMQLDIPKGTVKSRRFYGLRTLRLVLQRHESVPLR